MSFFLGLLCFMLKLLYTISYGYRMSCYLFLVVGTKWRKKIHASLPALVEDGVMSSDDATSDSEESDVAVDVSPPSLLVTTIRMRHG